jgi:tartrate dehydrogenase/decarboxylase/D-malate dehydrogenase
MAAQALTVVARTNAQRQGMVVWDEITAKVASQFLDVTWDKMVICAMTARMSLRHQSLDSAVVTNLYPVILPDLAGVLAGSLGVASRSNIDPEFRYPSMFEPIHGSVFVIAGTTIANSVATFWTAVQMLEHLGGQAAASLMRALKTATAEGVLTPGVGRTATTQEVTDAVCRAIRASNI